MALKVAVLLLVVSPLAGSRTAAQDAAPKSPPLEIKTTFSRGGDAEFKGDQSLVVQLHYTGEQPLRGYLVRLKSANSHDGKYSHEQFVEEIRDSQQPMIAPGEDWTRTVCTVPKKMFGEATTVTATVDFLKFADGSVAGPAALARSHQLIGMLDGIDFSQKTTQLERYVSPIQPQTGPLPVKDVETQTIGPLKIESGVWLDEHGRELLAMQVTNESSTAIRGYLLTASFFDRSNGDRIRRVSTKELETHGNSADYLAPGASWVADPRKFSYSADGSPAKYTVTVDLVVFEDGSTFGPKKSSESQEVIGMLRGIDRTKGTSQQTSANK
jgi:hypothetical protein